jgi:hypothetical protein
MKRSTLLLLTLAFASPAVWALKIDPKALARYDISYVVCESEFPEMRGHRDDAYLSLWQAKADTAGLAKLADIRKGQDYRSERARLLKANARPGSPPASSPIKQECQVLWGEARKFTQTKP